MEIEELAQKGVSNDALNALSLHRQQVDQDKGISVQKHNSRTEMPIVSQVSDARPTGSTIVPFMETGYSAHTIYHGREGRFNFDTRPRLDGLTPSPRYKFEAENGETLWGQLEEEYQPKRWEENESAEQDYETLKGIPVKTRRVMLERMWQDPMVATTIDNAITGSMPFEELKPVLSHFDTERQTFSVDTLQMEEAGREFIEMKQKLEDEQFRQGMKLVTDMFSPENIEKLEKEDMQLQLKALAKQYELEYDPERQMPLEEVLDTGFDTSIMALAYLVMQDVSGDKTAKSKFVNMILKSEELAQQNMFRSSVGHIVTMGSDLPVMAPSMLAGGALCAKLGLTTGPLGATAAGAGCAFAIGFGVPAGIRETLTLHMLDELQGSETPFWDKLVSVGRATGIEGIVGFLTGGMGHLARAGVSRRLNRKSLIEGSVLSVEATTMSTAGAVLHGEEVTLKGIVGTAFELMVLKGGTHSLAKFTRTVRKNVHSREANVVKNLMKLYEKVGIHPDKVLEDAKNRPGGYDALLAALTRDSFDIPQMYRRAYFEAISVAEHMNVSKVEGVTAGLYEKDGKYHINIHDVNETVGFILKRADGGMLEIDSVSGEITPAAIKAMLERVPFPVRETEAHPGIKTEAADVSEADLALINARNVLAEKPKEEWPPEMREALEEIQGEVLNIFDKTVGEKELERAEKTAVDLSEKMQESITGFRDIYKVNPEPFGEIERLDIEVEPLHTHIVVTHSADGKYGGKLDIEASGHQIHFGSDSQAVDNAGRKTDPVFVRAQIRFNKPLDLRKDIDFDNATDGAKDAVGTAAYLNRKGIITDGEAQSVRTAGSSKAEQQHALSEVLKARGYDAILYKNTQEGREREINPEDAVALLRSTDTEGRPMINPLGYAKLSEDGRVGQWMDTLEAAGWSEGAAGGSNNLGLSDTAIRDGLMNMPALLQLYSAITEGKAPSVVKGFRKPGVRGQARGEEIKILAALGKDKFQALATMAHEIGHVGDYVEGTPSKTMARGNILGRIASLHKNFSHYVEGKIGGQKPLTKKEKDALKRKAEDILKKQIDELSEDVEIQRDLGLTPKDIKDIFTGVAGRAEADPAIYQFIANTSRAQKKEILRSLARGIIPEEILSVAGKKPKEDVSEEVSKEAIKEKYQEMLLEEVKRRGLLSLDVVTNELKALTELWRPFDPQANVEYTKYRYNSKELYADFVSALLLNRQWVMAIAPNAYRGFMGHLDKKPRFKKEYHRIISDLAFGGDAVLKKARGNLIDGFIEADAKTMRLLEERIKADKDNVPSFMEDFVDSYYMIHKDVASVKEIPPHLNPVRKIDDYRYQTSEGEGYINAIDTHIKQPIVRLGLTDEMFGEYLFHRRVANERAELFNPEGFERESSGEIVKKYESRFPEIVQVANKYWEIRQGFLIKNLRGSEMFPEHLLKKLEDNNFYATFDVVEYIESTGAGGMGSAIKKQYGTLKRIGNPYSRTIVNDLMLMRQVSRNIAVKSSVDFYGSRLAEDAGLQAPIRAEWGGPKSGWLEPKDPTLGLVKFYRNGKVEGVYLPKKIATSLMENPHKETWLTNNLRLANNLFRKVYTEYNYGFWMFNFIRDYFRTARNLPATGPITKALPVVKLAQYAPYMLKGLVTARRSVKGVDDATIRDALKNNQLISVLQEWGEVEGKSEFDVLTHRYSQRAGGMKEFRGPVDRLFRGMHATAQTLERTHKFGAKEFIEKHFPNMPKEEKSHFIRVYAGSPPFLRKGSNPNYNLLAMFSNAIKEGWRGDYEVFRQRPGEFINSMVQTTIVPKIIQYGMLYGMFGDDEDSQLAQRVMQGVGSHDMSNYLIWPIGLTDTGKSVYIRIPQDETSRLIGAMFSTAISEEASGWDIASTAAGQIPSMSPILSLMGSTLTSLATGNAPHDTWRGESAISQKHWEAGGYDAAKEIGKWASNELGGGIVYRFSREQTESIESGDYGFLERLIGYPILQNALGRFIKITDYGVTEKLTAGADDIRSQRASDRLKIERELRQSIQDPDFVISDETIDLIGKYGRSMKKTAKGMIIDTYGRPVLRSLENARSNEERKAILERAKRMKLLIGDKR